MAFKPTRVRIKAVFRYIFCVLNCNVFGADDYRTCTKIYYNLSYIILKTKINLQNAVTFFVVINDGEEI